MASPELIDTPTDEWTRVASNATSGRIHVFQIGERYYQTYRNSGDPPPPNNVSDGIPILGPYYDINFNEPVDVYIFFKANKRGNETGRVRYDSVHEKNVTGTTGGGSQETNFPFFELFKDKLSCVDYQKVIDEEDENFVYVFLLNDQDEVLTGYKVAKERNANGERQACLLSFEEVQTILLELNTGDVVELNDGSFLALNEQSESAVDLSKCFDKLVVANKLVRAPFDDIEVTSKNGFNDPTEIRYRYNTEQVAQLSITYDSCGDFERVQVVHSGGFE